MKAKTVTRILSEKIQSKTGLSLVFINFQAHQLVEMGLYPCVRQALEYILELSDELR